MTIKTVVIGSLRLLLQSLAETPGPEKVALLLGGKTDSEVIVKAVFRVNNVKGSPVEFEGDPWHLIVAHKVAEKYGIEVVGVFHTHPSCPASPSINDVEGMKKWPYPWIIACPGQIRAWILDESSSSNPIEIEIK